MLCSTGSAESTENAKVTSTLDLKVLESVEVKLPNRSIIYKRVEPPAVPVSPSATQAVLDATNTATETLEEKSEVLLLSATVHDRRVSELRWSFRQRRYTAVSNIDMNYFRGLGGFETGGTAWLLVMGIGNETSESSEALAQSAVEKGWPWRMWHWFSEAQPAPVAEYVLVNGDSPPEPGVLAAIDALHAFYNANRQTLIADFERREAENAARANWLKVHPPVPKDTTVHFWPKKNSRYLRTDNPEGKR